MDSYDLGSIPAVAALLKKLLDYKDRMPYIKAELIEDFKQELDTDSQNDLVFDKQGNLKIFTSKQYLLRLTIYPDDFRVRLCKLVASSGKLCPLGQYLYNGSWTNSLSVEIDLAPSRIDPNPKTFEYQFLPREEKASEVKFSMKLDRWFFSTVPVTVERLVSKEVPEVYRVTPKPISQKKVIELLNRNRCRK